MRPPIGETRIKAYDGHQVTFEYFDHHHKTKASVTVPVFDFIKHLIRHIPDRYFAWFDITIGLVIEPEGNICPSFTKHLNKSLKKQ